MDDVHGLRPVPPGQDDSTFPVTDNTRESDGLGLFSLNQRPRQLREPVGDCCTLIMGLDPPAHKFN